MLSFRFKQYFKLIAASVIFWSLAFAVFIMVRYFAGGSEEGIDISQSNEAPVTDWLDFALYLGIAVGFVYGTVEFVFNRLLSKWLAVWLSLIIRALIYLIFLIFSLTFVSHYLKSSMDLDLPTHSGWWKNSHAFWLVVGYFMLCSLLFTLFRMMNERYSSGKLFNMLFGKYRRPVEEDKIFMFLDLKSSTTIAERLGHLKYSKLIQDCFFDLNRILGKYNAEVYQYVGDEAVISWDFKSGLKNRRCVNIYFDFDRLLNRRARYYQKRYGLIPVFKAGVHGGTLIVTEVGAVKKELAYHGDVINTTARIQAECNKYDTSFLISEELLNEMYLKPFYKTEKIGGIALKGKQELTYLYSIEAL